MNMCTGTCSVRFKIVSNATRRHKSQKQSVASSVVSCALVGRGGVSPLFYMRDYFSLKALFVCCTGWSTKNWPVLFMKMKNN